MRSAGSHFRLFGKKRPFHADFDRSACTGAKGAVMTVAVVAARTLPDGPTRNASELVGWKVIVAPNSLDHMVA
jgi:hypothetical protein